MLPYVAFLLMFTETYLVRNSALSVILYDDHKVMK